MRPALAPSSVFVYNSDVAIVERCVRSGQPVVARARPPSRPDGRTVHVVCAVRVVRCPPVSEETRVDVEAAPGLVSHTGSPESSLKALLTRGFGAECKLVTWEVSCPTHDPDNPEPNSWQIISLLEFISCDELFRMFC